ncbi:Putative HotDog domain superfamily, acyl-CoA thioesterase, double hotdog domain-containing protein [Septoria linicola]|uniref:HotDog domain superfamily, acyl-CoA thioesterase, double hotdog domain-containing protein n=1 Tax=Septoria linicola TaxID=215465 RepID=A0A9Q9EK51_9PEZI|nr:Putative HotDog domain superfamily, acyl-CoA thioesterase, double hotdog domain-containing protein [Septoria linicola]
MPQEVSKFYRGDGKRGKELFTFEEVAIIEPIDSHTYKANIHPEFSYGTSAHGGFILAILWKTITLHFTTTLAHLSQPHTFSLHNEFLRPCSTGPVTITIRDVRLGKATSTIHATLTQSSQDRSVCYATNHGPRALRNTLSLNTSYPSLPSSLPPCDFPSVLSGDDKHWFRYDVGRDPATPNHTLCNVIFVMQRSPPTDAATKRTTTQWITPRIPSERWTTPMLGLIMDHSVPPIENFFPDAPHNSYSMPARSASNEAAGLTSYDHPPWSSPRYYPTISMTIDIKRQLPPEGEKWLLLRWHTKSCVDGRFDVEAEVWDQEGRLVALGQSLWYVIDVSVAEGERVRQAERKGIRAAKGESKI